MDKQIFLLLGRNLKVFQVLFYCHLTHLACHKKVEIVVRLVRETLG